MKLTYMTSLACASLLLGSAIASAQNSSNYSSNPNSSSAQQGTSEMPSPGSGQKGNDLDTSSKNPQVSTKSPSPPAVGQDKSTGNDMMNPKDSASGSTRQASASRPDFGTLDKKNKGKLTAADVRSNRWLSKNFAKCDTDHDGTLDRTEYESCH